MLPDVSPPPPPEPCVLVFVIILLLVCIAVLLLRLYEMEERLAWYKAHDLTSARRMAAGFMILSLGVAVAAMGLLLVWARMGQC